MRALVVLAFVVFSVILTAYFGLVPLGSWFDEFETVDVYARGGWDSLASRLLRWSPRPFSELLIFLYAQLVRSLRTPLIGPMLAALWVMLGVSVVAVPLAGRRAFLSGTSWRQAILLSLGLWCLMLVGHPVSEFFYWPLGSVAYIPVAAGVCAVLWMFIIVGVDGARAPFVAALALSVVALSAEVGATLVAAFCLMVFAQALKDRLARTPAFFANRVVAPLTLPFGAAIAVLVAVRFGRVESEELLVEDSQLAHHLLPALSEAASRSVVELLSVDGVTMTPMHVALGIATKALFCLATFGILRPVVASPRTFRAEGRLLAFLGLACFASLFVSLAAAVHHFGKVCCQRHGTFRQIMVFLGLMAFSVCAAAWMRHASGERLRAPATARTILFLLASVIIPASFSARDVAVDYRRYGAYRDIQKHNWTAGSAPGDHFVYRVPTRGRIVGGLKVTEGTHTLADDSGWLIHSIIVFFRKKSVTFQMVDVDANGRNGH